MPYLRATLVWVLLMLAEMVHAIIRNAVLMPFMGDFRARQVSVFTGALIIFGIAWLTVRWMRAPGRRAWLMIGLLWVMLTIAFEISLGRLVFHYDWSRILSDYNLLRGGLMPLGLLMMGLSPLLANRFRHQR